MSNPFTDKLPELSVVLPAHNEAENIEGMLLDVQSQLRILGVTAETIVVDDGSTDATAEIVGTFAAGHPGVRLLRHASNQGYGGALYTGFSSAAGRLVFLTDADRQFDLGEMCALISKIADADIVAGFRSPRRDPSLRRLFGWGWNLAVRLFFGTTGRDVDCAFKIFRGEVLRALLPLTRSRGATFSVELLVLARRQGYSVAEHAVRGHRPRQAGSPSGARPEVIIRAFRDLLHFRIRLMRRSDATDSPTERRTTPPV